MMAVINLSRTRNQKTERTKMSPGQEFEEYYEMHGTFFREIKQ